MSDSWISHNRGPMTGSLGLWSTQDREACTGPTAAGSPPLSAQSTQGTYLCSLGLFCNLHSFLRVFIYSLRMPMSPLLPHQADRGDGGRQLEIRGRSLCLISMFCTNIMVASAPLRRSSAGRHYANLTLTCLTTTVRALSRAGPSSQSPQNSKFTF